MRKIWIIALALLPPLALAGWTLRELRKTERQLRGLDNFKGMHLDT
jgi:hypothetical protein